MSFGTSLNLPEPQFSYLDREDGNNMEHIVLFEEGNGNPVQYSRLENPMDKGAWRAAVLGVETSQTGLSD